MQAWSAKNNNPTSRRQLTSVASKVSIPTGYRQCQTNNWTPRVSCIMFLINDLITIALNHDPISRQNFKLFHCRRPIHAHTVRRRIQEVGLHCHRPKKGCILTNRHKAVRLNRAQAHLQWNCMQWGSVLFTDESNFNAKQQRPYKSVPSTRSAVFGTHDLLVSSRTVYPTEPQRQTIIK